MLESCSFLRGHRGVFVRRVLEPFLRFFPSVVMLFPPASIMRLCTLRGRRACAACPAFVVVVVLVLSCRHTLWTHPRAGGPAVPLTRRSVDSQGTFAPMAYEGCNDDRQEKRDEGLKMVNWQRKLSR